MAHLVATQISVQDKKITGIDHDYLEKDILSTHEFSNKVISLLFGTYKDCARQFRDYVLEESKSQRGPMDAKKCDL